MKKATYTTIVSVLSDIDFENKAEIMAELNKEINRGADAKAAKAAEYEAVKDTVSDVLRSTTTPLTAAEIFEGCESDLPEGFTRNKVSYALLNYWTDDVVKIEGKVNTYRIK